MSDQTNTNSEPQGDGGGRISRRRKKRHWDGSRWWEDRSVPQKVLIGIGIGILAVGAIFLFGLITMLLWNWLMPEIFGLPRVTFWQAWGLLILSSILIKGFGNREGGSRSDRKRKRHLRRYMQDGSGSEGENPPESPEAPVDSSE